MEISTTYAILELEGLKIKGWPYTPKFGIGIIGRIEARYSKTRGFDPSDTHILVNHGLFTEYWMKSTKIWDARI